MKQAERALEAAIRGVEQFSQEEIGLPPPSPAPQLAPPSVPARSLREIQALPPDPSSSSGPSLNGAITRSGRSRSAPPSCC